MQKVKKIIRNYGAGILLGLLIAGGFLLMDMEELATITKTVDKWEYTIVIDSGHGGIDPGKVSADGIYEKDVNLEIAKKLQEVLQQKKCKVVMTRETDQGLYEEAASNKKMSDMKKRIEIMNESDPDLIISIHQNSFSDATSRGAQVFYQADSEKGEALAKSIQDTILKQVDPDNRRQIKANRDYYLLQNSKQTMVIVECGFLSNQQEAEQLQNPEYQSKLAEAIAEGALQYLGNRGENEDRREEENENENTASRPKTVSGRGISGGL